MARRVEGVSDALDILSDGAARELTEEERVVARRVAANWYCWMRRPGVSHEDKLEVMEIAKRVQKVREETKKERKAS